MFLPDNQTEKQQEAEERKTAFKNIETWSLEIIPAAIRDDATVSVQEVQCGDPQCAPIDTAVTIVFKRYEGLHYSFFLLAVSSQINSIVFSTLKRLQWDFWSSDGGKRSH